MQQMSAAIEGMELEEDRLLNARESAASTSRRFMLVSLLSTLAVAAGVLVVLFRSIRAQMHARRLAESDLVQATEIAQRARREADEANRAKSSFLAAMSHEIRTPMNGVLGLLELLSLGRLEPEQHETLDVVRQSGRSLLRIVDDILDFSRIEAGKLQLNPHPASMKRLVQRVCQMYSGVASSKGLLLQGKVDAAVARAHVCDELRLEQVLNNFVSNAIKFTERGSVSVEVSPSGGDARAQELTFRVIDTGIGIAQDKMDRLFQPFSQAEAGTSSRFGGTGLGLTICRRIAELMGGRADIRSEEGVGTVASLVVRLPIADEQSLGMDPTELEEMPLEHCRAVPDLDVAANEGTLLLVVDDHPTNRMLLKRQLNMLGYAVETVPDGKSALEAYLTGRFGAVLTDCNMPEMSGYELARMIRASEARSGRGRIPILACTANAMASEAAICADAGMDDCVVKPVQLMELRRRLERWLPLPPAAEIKGGSRAVDEGDDDVPFNFARLAEVAGEGASEQDQVLREFYRFNDIDVAELRQAVLDTADLDRITHLAHRIHGSSRMVGAFGLGSASHAVEVASRSGDVAGVRSSFSALEHELNRLETYFDRRFGAELQRG
jgi:signal transduction histidine kinase/CheY-like chemotaxis protein/HPt (histidine-containing phosphotransfer) domain-containing protein